MPRDRAYFIYHDYNNALNTSIDDFSGDPLRRGNQSLQRYAFGYEKTFHQGYSSVEVRMPFLGSSGLPVDSGFSSSGVSIGNLSVIAKRLLVRTEQTALATGVGVSVPTGDNSVFGIADHFFTFHNHAVHILPYLGLLQVSPNERVFVQSFVQLDIPTNGNRISFRDSSGTTSDDNLGRLRDQTVFYFDVSSGVWLYRNEAASLITGMAFITELHYATALQGARTVEDPVGVPGWSTGFKFGNARNRFDNLDMTLMIHTELRNNTDLRIAGVFPLSEADDRFFDSELMIMLIRRF